MATTIPIAPLKELISGLTGQTVTIVEGEPEPYVAAIDGEPGRYFTLDLDTYATKGVDDYRQMSDPVTGAISYSTNGYRMLTIRVKAISFDINRTAHDMLEQLRMRLRSQTSKMILRPLCLALIDFPGGIQPLSIVADTRELWAATMDIRVAFAPTESASASDDPGGVILTVSPIVRTYPIAN